MMLLGEVFWIWLWVRARSAERAILYVAAIFTSIFVAAHVSPWFARRFFISGSTFKWLRNQMLADTRAVGLISHVIPPLPTSSGFYSQTHWVALHVLQALMTILMSGAIFLLFIVIEYLMIAFWDDDRPSFIAADRVLANLAGVIAGLMAAMMTVWFLASLSWISTLHVIRNSVAQSLFLTWLDQALQFLPRLHAML